MDDRPHLRSLADHAGILPAYVDVAGVRRSAKDETRAALLDAMGFDVSTEAAASRELEDIERSGRQRVLGPVRVVIAAEDRPVEVVLRIPGVGRSSVEWHVELNEEDGTSHSVSGRALPPGDDRTILVPLPVTPPPGFHMLRARLALPAGLLEADQSLVITPGRCIAHSQRVDASALYGVWTNLYTLRSRGNAGVGDLTDLRELAGRLGEHGAAFVGVNPLHALRNCAEHISPYSPVSRLLRSFLYLDVEAVPEFADCSDARTLFRSPEFQTELAEVRSARQVLYERIAALKSRILRLLHGAFLERHAKESTDRGRAYTDYVKTQGKTLVDFATFVVLDARLTKKGDGDRRHWPARYRDPDSPEVKEFRAAHQRDVDFQCFLQFELDRQLAAVAVETQRVGMPLGIYHDLAVGSDGCGSDAWGFPGLFVPGVEVGAPPDPYCDTGQTWGFPPLHPRRLTEQRYQYWIQLLRNAMSHAGMLRIDHVMGLFRQFWVPAGCAATDGAYVRYPADDLLGILALESHRHGTVVVGEDLGTVPPEVPAAMADRRILSSRVMYFERNGDGSFRSAASYAPRALVTATTHDHAPLAGFWTGRDIELRHEIGLFRSSAERDEVRAERARVQAALLRLLVDEGLLTEDHDAGAASVCRAVYTFLARTGCPLVGVSLDDLACEVDPVNIPGVGHATYPSWSRRMRRSVEEILDDPDVAATLAQIQAELEKRPEG